MKFNPVNKIVESLNLNESAKFRPFDKSDWYAFAGATKSDDGYPQIAETSDSTIIISREDINSRRFVVNVITPSTEDYGGKVNTFLSEKQALLIANKCLKMNTQQLEDYISRW